MEVGKSYYFINHAYHNYIGTVVEILGPRSAKLINVRKIHRCSRNWTLFFKEGFKTDTQFDIFPDGHEVFDCHSITPWVQEIP